MDSLNVTSASVVKGEHAKVSALVGAMAISDMVKSTLGPKGLDKILQSQSSNTTTITNDGATILKNIPVHHPSAKILVDMSMTQDKEIGDGTTSVVVLAGELLREAEKLLKQKLHPNTILTGWRKAVKCAAKHLETLGVDNSKDPEKFREDLINVAKTTLSSKIVASGGAHLEHFAKLTVDAVLKIKTHTIESIQIIKKPGADMGSSYLANGFILDKSFGIGQKKVIDNPRIMVANTPMDSDKIKIFGAKVKVDSMAAVADIEAAEKHKMKRKCEKILAHKIDLFINRQLIYNYPCNIFTDAGVSSIEHADFEGVERLSLVLGADIVSTFDAPDKVKLGTCKRVEEIMIGEDTLIHFQGPPTTQGEACTIVLRGASQHLLDEIERAIHDALCVLTEIVQRDQRVVYGGGCSEMQMALEVDKLAKQTPGKQAFAIESFSVALRSIPKILADNAGYDSLEICSQLRAAHSEGKITMGVDMDAGSGGNYMGEVGCMKKKQVVESLGSKLQSLTSAHEAAEQIVRVDDIITLPPRRRAG